MISRLRTWLLDKLQPHDLPVSSGACANRRWVTFMRGPLEYTTVCRDTRDPDGYSREELMVMLYTVRKHEAIMGWKVPEPPTKGHKDYAPTKDERPLLTLDEWVEASKVQLEEYREEWKGSNDFHKAPHTWREWWRTFLSFEFMSW